MESSESLFSQHSTSQGSCPYQSIDESTTVLNILSLSRTMQLRALEALLFASEEPLSATTLYSLLQGTDEQQSISTISTPADTEALESRTTVSALSQSQNGTASEVSPEAFIQGLIDELNEEFEASGRVFRIVELAREGGTGYQFATTPEYGELLTRLVKSKSKKRLSKAGLETLAIIAYRQPISKPEIDSIRGVGSSETINRLLEKNLITIVGRSEGVGRALLYGTTDDFLRLFGLRSLADLPKPRELEELMAEHPDILDTV
ncbi:MAG: SMC-Scp complex subunit ScpB [Bacteroidota bacterium]|nr:SMC-Scp complex subunit ScpB [Candidatus Kapabacteria bacterium]MDW8219610.1 SMC-Scp complex subunit ScpB [Bacteroidota bacterium]